jgi:ribosome-associated protein
MHKKALLDNILDALSDLKAVSVLPLDVHKMTSITEYMVIATGTSSRHVSAIADNVVRKLKMIHIEPLGIEGDTDAEWVLVDLGEVVVHIMQAKARDFYQLEKLWTYSPVTQSLEMA